MQVTQVAVGSCGRHDKHVDSERQDETDRTQSGLLDKRSNDLTPCSEFHVRQHLHKVTSHDDDVSTPRKDVAVHGMEPRLHGFVEAKVVHEGFLPEYEASPSKKIRSLFTKHEQLLVTFREVLKRERIEVLPGRSLEAEPLEATARAMQLVFEQRPVASNTQTSCPILPGRPRSTSPAQWRMPAGTESFLPARH